MYSTRGYLKVLLILIKTHTLITTYEYLVRLLRLFIKGDTSLTSLYYFYYDQGLLKESTSNTPDSDRVLN